MPMLSRPGCEIYYEETGSGPAIIFAHGAGGNHLSWWQQVPVFAEGYRCVAYDHRGFGRSVPTGGLGPAAFVDDLLALMDELKIEQTALVAQSMGGWSCLGAALQAPERVSALVMGGTNGGLLTEEMRPYWEETRKKVQDQGLQGLAYHPNLRERNPSLAFLYDEIMQMNPPLEQGLLQHMSDAAPDPDAVAKLSMPILWVVGGDDPLQPPAIIRMAREHVPGSQYYESAETGHSVYFERATEFNSLLSRFLVDVDWGPGI